MFGGNGEWRSALFTRSPDFIPQRGPGSRDPALRSPLRGGVPLTRRAASVLIQFQLNLLCRLLLAWPQTSPCGSVTSLAICGGDQDGGGSENPSARRWSAVMRLVFGGATASRQYFAHGISTCGALVCDQPGRFFEWRNPGHLIHPGFALRAVHVRSSDIRHSNTPNPRLTVKHTTDRAVAPLYIPYVPDNCPRPCQSDLTWTVTDSMTRPPVSWASLLRPLWQRSDKEMG
jgi:hypothetical protein